MFNCRRCGNSFNATVAATIENCPRCKSRDGVETPLTFKLFQTSSAVSTGGLSPGRDDAVKPAAAAQSPR
jgi:hypothetical protein